MLIFYGKYIQGGNTAISIHLMLMLIVTASITACSVDIISIHLMLMLINGHRGFFNVHEHISIHLMLMLISITFRYNSCLIAHFNTSHVNVNRYMDDAYICRREISIHLMLMLIAKNSTIR